LVFRGFDREGAQTLLQYQMTPVVSSWEQLEHLQAVALSPVNIHLKFDTGMNRLGFRPDEAPKLLELLRGNKTIVLKAILTHLLEGEDALNDQGRSAFQLRQLHQLRQVFKEMNIFCHALNSAGILNLMQLKKQGADGQHPLYLQDWGLRPGLMLYGYNPVKGISPCELRPVMTLKSHVAAFRTLQAGETVSYGGHWTAPQESVIAIVPIGYADGYHRILSNQASVLFAGERVPVVGSICMDYLMLDVSQVVKGKPLQSFKDQEVILFGQSREGNDLSPEELAKEAKTITWEMLTSVGERVPRVYKGQDASFIYQELGDNK